MSNKRPTRTTIIECIFYADNTTTTCLEITIVDNCNMCMWDIELRDRNKTIEIMTTMLCRSEFIYTIYTHECTKGNVKDFRDDDENCNKNLIRSSMHTRFNLI